MRLLIGGSPSKIFHLKEFQKALIDLGVECKLVVDTDISNGFPSKKISNWLITKQNEDGSWNETHVKYDNPSSVFTAICGLTLLEVYEEFSEIEISKKVLDSTADFLIKQEIKDGHFKKSEHYHADVLNADAMVSAFLIKFGYYKNNSKYS